MNIHIGQRALTSHGIGIVVDYKYIPNQAVGNYIRVRHSKAEMDFDIHNVRLEPLSDWRKLNE